MSYSFDAVIFDLDGVITRTATLHSAAWKKVFDSYLKEREEKYGEPFREFTVKEDYLPYVDGKPRYEGVESFLKSRGIEIPYGDPSDPPEKETCCAIGNRKNKAFNEIIQRDGVEVFSSTILLIEELKQSGIKLGVASSSKNCRLVLEHAKLIEYFGTIVDGTVSAELGLRGKPEPDIFTKACSNLGAGIHRSVVVEDAVSGVQAGKRGNFGLVIGVARDDNSLELKKNGADLVVRDIEELGGFDRIEKWFAEDLIDDSWRLNFYGAGSEKERAREILTATGNGFIINRHSVGEMNFPSSYMSGSFKNETGKDTSEAGIAERFVPAPGWMYFNFRIENGPWLNPCEAHVCGLERTLDMRNGLFKSKMTVKDSAGRETGITFSCVTNMASRHQSAIKISLKPQNYHGVLTLRTRIDAGFPKSDPEGYGCKSLRKTECGYEGPITYLVAKTDRPEIFVAETAINKIFINDSPVVVPWMHRERENSLEAEVQVNLPGNSELTIERFVSVYNSLNISEKEILQLAKKEVTKTVSFRQVLGQTSWVWDKLWTGAGIDVEGDRLAQKILRTCIYHLMAATLHTNTGPGFGIPVFDSNGEVSWSECTEERDLFNEMGEKAGFGNRKTLRRPGDLRRFYCLEPEDVRQIVFELTLRYPEEYKSTKKFPGERPNLGEVTAIILFSYCNIPSRKKTEASRRKSNAVKNIPEKETDLPSKGENAAAFAIKNIAGVSFKGGTPVIEPLLPAHWERLSLNCCIDGYLIRMVVNKDKETEIDSNNKNNVPLKFISDGKIYVVNPGEKIIVKRAAKTETTSVKRSKKK